MDTRIRNPFLLTSLQPTRDEPPPQPQPECECGGMLFILEDGTKFCLNCGYRDE